MNTFAFRFNSPYHDSPFFSDSSDCHFLFKDGLISFRDSFGELFPVHPRDVDLLLAFDPDNKPYFANDIVRPAFNPADLDSYPTEIFSIQLLPVLRDKAGHSYSLPKGWRLP